MVTVLVGTGCAVALVMPPSRTADVRYAHKRVIVSPFPTRYILTGSAPVGRYRGIVIRPPKINLMRLQNTRFHPTSGFPLKISQGKPLVGLSLTKCPPKLPSRVYPGSQSTLA